MLQNTSCPLCLSTKINPYWQDKFRHYLSCTNCQLVFVAPSDRLNAEKEKAIYDLHQNRIDDLGYQKFLSRLVNPLVEKLKPASQGLDFGCGPGPALAYMLQEKSHHMALYDLYYYPNQEVLLQCYDFIVATEVIEHLYQPNDIWQQWLNLLRPNGYLGIMTKLVTSLTAFTKWHYKNDQTHVAFFSKETFYFLAKRDHLEIEFYGNDVILLRKK